MHDIYLEKEILKNGYISKHEIRERIEGEYEENEDEFVIDGYVSDKFNEYEHLVKIFENNVFISNEETKTITVHSKFSAKKEHLLCLKLMETNDEKLRVKMSRLFEEIVAESLISLMGSNSYYELVDASNKDRCIDIKTLSKNMGLEFRRELQKYPQEGDGCCDIVFWKKIDENPGIISILTQCKSGAKWKEGKAVELGIWNELINFTIPPIRAYAISDIIKKEYIDSQSVQKGLIFDRVRLIKLLANFNSEKIIQIRKKIENLNLN
jgi:hypothetical protein